MNNTVELSYNVMKGTEYFVPYHRTAEARNEVSYKPVSLYPCSKVNHVKGWQSINIWEQPKQIRIAIMTKLRAT
jgi:hypothetical protein